MMPVTQMPTFGTSQSPALYFGTDENDPGGGSAGGGKRPAKPSKKGGKKTGGGKPAKKQGAKRKGECKSPFLARAARMYRRAAPSAPATTGTNDYSAE
jgi:hypothetical protein